MQTTVSVRGQTVIPAEIRDRYGLHKSSRVEWIADGRTIRLVPLPRDPIGGAKGMFGKSALGVALLKARREDRKRG